MQEKIKIYFSLDAKIKISKIPTEGASDNTCLLTQIINSGNPSF
jgi:hypothetical protein